MPRLVGSAPASGARIHRELTRGRRVGKPEDRFPALEGIRLRAVLAEAGSRGACIARAVFSGGHEVLGVALIPSTYESLDAYRRTAGLMMDAAGNGPSEQPWQEIAAWPGARLRDYGGAKGGPPLLIIPAPFKRAYIWDLLPAVSPVRRALDEGFRVFVLEWLPEPADAASSGSGLLDFALRLPGAACEAVEAAAGRGRVLLAGHSLGGTLAAIHAALRPARIAGLALIDAPLAFGPRDGGPLAAAIAAAPPVDALAAGFRSRVPGSAINAFSARAAPEAFLRQPARDALACAALPDRLAIHLRVRRWTLDEYPMPSRLFGEIGEALYREDRFRRGTLRIGDETARLGELAAPVVAVVNPPGLIVPPRSMLGGLRCCSGRRLVLRYREEPGPMIQHLGPLVGPGAHAALWPRILAEMKAMAG